MRNKYLCIGPRIHKRYNLYISETGMLELLFFSQKPKAKSFSKYCYNVMFPHIRQQLTSQMVDDLRCEHQQAIEAILYENKSSQDEI